MPIDTYVDRSSLISVKVNSPLRNHIFCVSLEISASTPSWEKCTPLLGASLLECARFFLVVKVFLLKNIEKDLAGFSSFVEKGFPGYFLCSCAWCFFL